MLGLNLFIYTNISPNLYEYSNDGLEELDELFEDADADGMALHKLRTAGVRNLEDLSNDCLEGL